MPTDITLSTGSYVRPYRAAKGSPRIAHIQETTCAASGLIRVGDVVSSDTLTASASNRIMRMENHIPSTAIYGIAAEGSTSDGSTTGLADPNCRRLPVWIAERDTEFVAYSKLSSVTHNSTLVGTNRVLSRDSTLGIWTVDAAVSTAGDVRIRVTEVLDPGASNGAVVFRFLSTALMLTD